MAHDDQGMMEQPYSINRLKRWNCASNALPNVDAIRELHIYDFDNTMFISPLPNRELWDQGSIGKLMNRDSLAQGGWWHNAAILSATGQGIEVEEPRAWEGHWNESIIELIRLSMAQEDALTVLLTGRSEGPFASLIQRMCKSKNLQFDIYGLKPLSGFDGQSFQSTMAFKQEFLTTMIRTYTNATGLRIYEDRPTHVKAFRGFFDRFNNDMLSKSIPRGVINAEVIEVTDLLGSLDPVIEVAAVQTLVNAHNESLRSGEAGPGHWPLMISKHGLYAAYQVKAEDSARLLALVALPKGAKKLATSVLITTYVANNSVLQKAGGRGKLVRFQVTAIGFNANRIWVARVQSIDTNAYTTLPQLQIVLALNGGARPTEARNIRQWHPLPSDQVVDFEAVVTEVFRLSLQEEKLPSATGSTDQAAIVSKKRSADHFKSDQSQSKRASFSQAHDQRGSRGKGPRAPRGDRGGRKGVNGNQLQNARGGHALRGNQVPRGANSNRGRGGRGAREVSGRRAGYKDHDAAGGAQAGNNERNMHNDY